MDKKVKRKKKPEVKEKKSEVKETEEKKSEIKEIKVETTEGPSEKDFFERQIVQLRQQLEVCDTEFQKKKDALVEVRGRLETELENERACVSHLKKVVTFETDRRLEVQEKLQTLRDQSELLERRALGKFVVSEKSREADKSQFLQQKLELESKLSLLEEIRLKRNSQLTRLKEVEESLEEKIAALREKTREEDMRQVDGLLKKREEFSEKCRHIRGEWREAFRLRMPVHAKKQLQDNVRLRKMYDTAKENLLQVQDKNRNLKMLQKSLDLQKEIQISSEEDAIKRKHLQEKNLQQLFLRSEELKTEDAQNFSMEDLDGSKNSTVEQIFGHGGTFQDLSEIRDRSHEEQGEMSSPERKEALKQKTNEEILQPENRHQETPTEGKKETDERITEKDISTSAHAAKPQADSGGQILRQKRKEGLILEDVVRSKIENIAAEQCRLLDKRHDVMAILKDQTDYKLSVQKELELNADENGVLMSAILRAGKIFEARSSKLDEGREMDFDLLLQMRILLDLAPDNN